MTELVVPALRVRQGGRDLYLCAVTSPQLESFATVSRVRRDGSAIAGYQRPEALAHVRNIRAYLQSAGALMPNALVVAFDPCVRFEAAGPAFGTLRIPADPATPAHERAGWIVDGQQRSAALRDADLPDFPIPVVGWSVRDDSEARSQFVLVNSTKPLPTGLVSELLPVTDAPLPAALTRKRFPSELLAELNFRDGSALRGLMRTPTQPDGVIKDTSMLRLLERSLSDGCLYRFRDPETGRGDVDAIVATVSAFFAAVSRTWPDAWGLPARKSRLMHGAGIVALGFLMDEIAETRQPQGVVTADVFAEDLAVVAPVCAWTSGVWEFGEPWGRRSWSEIQNTGKDARMLSDYLTGVLRSAARRRATA